MNSKSSTIGLRAVILLKISCTIPSDVLSNSNLVIPVSWLCSASSDCDIPYFVWACIMCRVCDHVSWHFPVECDTICTVCVHTYKCTYVQSLLLNVLTHACGDCGVGLQTVLHFIIVVGHTVHSVGYVWEELSHITVCFSHSTGKPGKIYTSVNALFSPPSTSFTLHKSLLSHCTSSSLLTQWGCGWGGWIVPSWLWQSHILHLLYNAIKFNEELY